MNTVKCPMGHGNMALRKVEKTTTFKGVDVSFEVEAYICNECSLEAGTVKSVGKVQRSIADAYRKKMDLITSHEIKFLHKSRGFTRQQLAKLMNIGIASIKRWETGMDVFACFLMANHFHFLCKIQNRPLSSSMRKNFNPTAGLFPSSAAYRRLFLFVPLLLPNFLN